MSAAAPPVDGSPVSGTPPPDNGLPVVAGPPARETGLYVFLALLLVGGIGLFTLMAQSREDARLAATGAPAEEGARIASPPPLQVPGEYRYYGRGYLPPAPDRRPRLGPAPVNAPAASVPPAITQPRSPAPAYTPPASLPDYTPPPQRYEPPFQPRFAEPNTPLVSRPDTSADDPDRVLATRFLNPALTIPKGTVIPAVLETALDSTGPGAVRALVQRDVRGFNGSRVLVPRGSRLYGVYDASLEQGQRRALITWERLMRPDGVMIALASPASDPLGRAGVRGKVDTKFLARFGNALLQSALDLGVGVATAAVTDGVVVLPGAVRTAPPVTNSQQIQPTLTVRHGTSVSVFVARDLDFSSVDN